MGKRAERSKRTYNRMAAGYDSTKEGLYTRAHRAQLIKNVCVSDGDTLLGVGCGNGDLLSALAQKAAANALGIDISDSMTTSPRTTLSSRRFSSLRIENASTTRLTPLRGGSHAHPLRRG